MKIFVGSDHAGYGLKEKLVPYLQSLGHEVRDMGAHEYDENDDYPDFVIPVAEEVSKDPEARGIIFGGSGQGEAICANKFRGVRAVVYYGEGKPAVADELTIIKLSREHNDSNVLSLAGRFLSEEEMMRAVTEWMETPFSGDERHKRRLQKIGNI